jgi:hypothetical protein
MPTHPPTHPRAHLSYKYTVPLPAIMRTLKEPEPVTHSRCSRLRPPTCPLTRMICQALDPNALRGAFGPVTAMAWLHAPLMPDVAAAGLGAGAGNVPQAYPHLCWPGDPQEQQHGGTMGGSGPLGGPPSEVRPPHPRWGAGSQPSGLLPTHIAVAVAGGIIYVYGLLVPDLAALRPGSSPAAAWGVQVRLVLLCVGAAWGSGARHCVSTEWLGAAFSLNST